MWKNKKKELRTVLLGRRVGTGRDRSSADSWKRKPKQRVHKRRGNVNQGIRGNVRDARL